MKTIHQLFDTALRKYDLRRRKRFIVWMRFVARKLYYEGFREAPEELEKSAAQYEQELKEKYENSKIKS